MYKTSLYFFCCFLFFISCDTEKNISDIEKRIEQLHAKAAEGPQVKYTNSKDSSYSYLTSAKKIIVENPQVADSLKAVNNYLLGCHFRGIQQTDSTLFYFNEAKNGIKDSMRYSQEISYFYYTYESYIKQNRYGDAIAVADEYKTKYDLDRKHSFNVILYFMYTNVSNLMGDYKNALKYNELELKQVIKTKDTIYNYYFPVLASRKAKYLYHSGQKEKAFFILDSLSANKERLHHQVNINIHIDYGVYKHNDGDYVTAIDYYKKAIPFIKERSDSIAMRSDLAVIYMNIGNAYMELKQYDKASIYLDSSKTIGFKDLNITDKKTYLQSKLKYAIASNEDINEVINEFDEVFDFQQKDYEKKFGEELNALKEANQKEKALEQEKELANYKHFKLRATLLWSGIGVLLLTFGALFYHRNNKLKLEKEHLRTQQRLLRAQMNPHFTFNTISTIRRMIDKNPDTAKRYLVKFSRLLETLFENSIFDYVSLEKELEALKGYMDLQKLRFGETFRYTIKLNAIEPDLVYIPGMLLQPVIENSITHGFSGITYPGEINIELKQNGRFILCRIEDNGRGMENDTAKNHRVSSTELIQSFLEKVSKSKMEFSNKSDHSIDEKGVIVTFAIPFKETPND